MLLQILGFFLTLAAARQPTRAEIKTRYNEVDCNAGGDMDLCDTGTTWDTSTTIKRCKCDSTGANTQPSRTDIKKMYNNGGNCNAGGNITLCGTGTAWNSTIKRCKCDSTEAAAAAAEEAAAAARTICATADEDNPATLTAPTGAFFNNVVFASYGLPTGSCGNFYVGSCHSTFSIGIAEGLLIGQNHVTISASNGVFGDPCIGTRKKLSIEVQWVYPPS